MKVNAEELFNKLKDRQEEREKILLDFREEVYKAAENHKKRLVNYFPDLGEQEIVLLLAADTVGEFTKFNVLTALVTGINIKKTAHELFDDILARHLKSASAMEGKNETH